jgi:hypothetical protein
MIVLPITPIVASQEPFLPDDAWKQIALFFHEPQYRLVNKLFRDTVVIHLFKPVTFGLRKSKKKSRWFREMISSDRLFIHDYVIFDNHSSAELLDAVIRKRGSVNVKFSSKSDDFLHRHDVVLSASGKPWTRECIVEFCHDDPTKKYSVTFLDHNDGLIPLTVYI